MSVKNEEREKPLSVLYNESKDIAIDSVESIISKVAETSYDFPIIKPLISIVKFSASVYNVQYAKKVLKFAEQINRNQISEEQKQKHIKKLKANPKYTEIEVDIIMEFLNKYSHVIKSEMAANIYSAYLNELINFRTMGIYLEILRDISVYDFSALHEMYEQKILVEEEAHDNRTLKNLANITLIDFKDGEILENDNILGDDEDINIIAKITDIGNEFSRIIFLNLDWKEEMKILNGL